MPTSVRASASILGVLMASATVTALGACGSGSPVGAFAQTDAGPVTQGSDAGQGMEDSGATGLDAAGGSPDGRGPSSDASSEAASGDAGGSAACPRADAGPMLNCAKQPSLCCFPDETNTGVPLGTTLTDASKANLPAGVTWDASTGSLNITQDGVTVSGLSVNGTIIVNANNVTIKNTEVSTCWPQGASVEIASSVTTFLIEDSSLHGQDAMQCSEGYGVQNSASGGLTIVGLRLHMYNGAKGWAGTGKLVDSYVETVAVAVDGSHNEPVYIPGSGMGSPALVQHDTLFNLSNQTAAVFPDCHTWGACDQMTIDDNLLAGGDYVLYGFEGTFGPSQDTVVTNNRFATLIYPAGGSYGMVTNLDTTLTTWSGNVWDDSNRPVTPDQQLSDGDGNCNKNLPCY